MDRHRGAAVIAVGLAQRVGGGPAAALAIQGANAGEEAFLRRIQPGDMRLALMGDDLVTGPRSGPLATA